MKIKDMPAWVLKHKTKGYTVRYNNGSFSLIKIKSVRVKDKPYPKLINEFVGIITKEGLIPKKTYNDNLNNDIFIEFGFSFFVYLNFRRDLKRALYNESSESKDLTIAAAITLSLFNDINDEYLEHTYLKTLLKVDSFIHLTDRKIKNANRLKLMIEDLLKSKIPNPIDRNILILKLKNTLINQNSNITSSLYSDSTIEIIERYGLKHK